MIVSVPPDDSVSDDITFRCPPVTESEISKIIDSLNNKLSSGYDEVPIKVIMFCKVVLIKPLVHLVNSSFISGIFTNRLKISKVTLIYKKGDPNDISNYRPISIL